MRKEERIAEAKRRSREDKERCVGVAGRWSEVCTVYSVQNIVSFKLRLRSRLNFPRNFDSFYRQKLCCH